MKMVYRDPLSRQRERAGVRVDIYDFSPHLPPCGIPYFLIFTKRSEINPLPEGRGKLEVRFSKHVLKRKHRWQGWES